MNWRDAILQGHKIHKPGKYTLRVSLIQSRRSLWPSDHQVFVGLSYGTNSPTNQMIRSKCGTFFGFLCGASPFLGIFEIQALSGASPKPEAPIFITGSAAKFEFDLDLVVNLTQVNQIVTCTLAVGAGGMACGSSSGNRIQTFQTGLRTLIHPNEGLRFVIVPTGLNVDDEMEARLNWVSL